MYSCAKLCKDRGDLYLQRGVGGAQSEGFCQNILRIYVCECINNDIPYVILYYKYIYSIYGDHRTYEGPKASLYKVSGSKQSQNDKKYLEPQELTTTRP